MFLLGKRPTAAIITYTEFQEAQRRRDRRADHEVCEKLDRTYPLRRTRHQTTGAVSVAPAPAIERLAVMRESRVERARAWLAGIFSTPRV